MMEAMLSPILCAAEQDNDHGVSLQAQKELTKRLPAKSPKAKAPKAPKEPKEVHQSLLPVYRLVCRRTEVVQLRRISL